jgi:hypothetical protein
MPGLVQNKSGRHGTGFGSTHNIAMLFCNAQQLLEARRFACISMSRELHRAELGVTRLLDRQIAKAWDTWQHWIEEPNHV